MKALSLFSGIGGFDLALIRQGHEIIGACEIDEYARQIYGRHFPGVPIHRDATKIDPNQLPDFDLLVAGFPCQAFSIAGKRRGFEDTRGTLFFEIARIAKQKRPRYLLLENVKGLLSHERGSTIRTIFQTLDELGYDTQARIINSKDFVPQNRERIFIVGHLRGTGRPKVFPFRFCDEATNREEQDGQERQTNCIDSNYWKGIDNHGQRTGVLTQVGTYQKPFLRRKTEPKRTDVIQYLKDNRKESISIIAEKTGITKTQLEHYFRLDKSGALPDKDDWLKLKEVMGFDDTWDEIMTEYVEDTSKFEMSSRVYGPDGISPTLEATGEKLIQVGNIDQKGHNSLWGRVYDPKGISATLNAQGGGLGAKTGLYAIPVLTPDRIEKRQNGRRFKEDGEPSFTLTAQDKHRVMIGPKYTQYDSSGKGHKSQNDRVYDPSFIGPTIPTTSTASKLMIQAGTRIRKLTPLECERLQGFPDNWTEGISDTQRYKCCGNAVTVPVVESIISSLVNN